MPDNFPQLEGAWGLPTCDESASLIEHDKVDLDDAAITESFAIDAVRKLPKSNETKIIYISP